MVRVFLTNGLAVMVVSAFFFALSDVVIKFISPMVAVTGIAGVVIFKDALPPGLLAGAFLILASGVGLNLMNRRSRRSGSVVSEER